MLPPDAVDLVVEDPRAAEEEMTRERRKGEPAVRGGSALHRVYRRGYVVDTPEGGREVGEVEVARSPQEEVFGIGDDCAGRAGREPLGVTTMSSAITHYRLYRNRAHHGVL